jgi:hypothetical protein
VCMCAGDRRICVCVQEIDVCVYVWRREVRTWYRCMCVRMCVCVEERGKDLVVPNTWTPSQGISTWKLLSTSAYVSIRQHTSAYAT